MPDQLPRLTDALADRYRLERELGQGGMATVYLAEDLRHRRMVAIKVLRPELAAIIGAERFLTEIKVTASLQHPHILPLFDSGETGGQVFYVMPYVAGESLRTRLEREHQLPVTEAIRITQEIASALEYAHRQGVIHRDIKPENILLHDGRALVADFGIALAVSNASGARLTQTGLSLGTPGYMSPEQAAGERTVDARSDVYSLGAVCYEMLAGQPPFVAPTAQALIAKLMTETPLPPSRSRKSVPPHVDAAILAALEKLPADRPSTTAAFVAALTAESAALPTRTVVRRRPEWWGALLGGVVLGLVTGGLVASRLLDRSMHDGRDQRAQLTFTGQAIRPALSPDGAFVAYIDRRCEHAQVDRCRMSLLVQEVGSTQSVPILVGWSRLSSPRWSHDGAVIVVAGELDSARSGLFAIPRLGGATRPLGPAGAFDTHPGDDSIIVVSARGSKAVALIMRLTDGAVIDSIPLQFGGIRAVSWAPEGRRLAFRTHADTLRIVARDGRETGSRFLRSRADLRWTTSGDAVLAFGTGIAREDDLLRIPVDDSGRIHGAPEVVMSRVPTLYQGEFDVARRTGRIAFATGTSTEDLWTFELGHGAATGRQRTRGTTWYGSPALSPDGSTAFYLRGDALGDNVYSLRLSDGTEEALTSQRWPGSDAVRISDDGHRLVYEHTGERNRILEVLELPSRRVTSREVAEGSDLIWPVGERGILQSGRGSALVILDSLDAPARQLVILDSLTDFTFAPAPDGRRAAILARTRQRTLRLGIVSLAGSEVYRVLHEFGNEEVIPGLSWDRDGGIYLGRWLPAEESPSIWRSTEAGRELVRVANLPTPCNPETVTVAAGGRTAICAANDARSDIWIVEGIGLGR